MSLCVADVRLKATSLNYSAVFIHTREQNITYNLFDPPLPECSLEPGGPMDPAFAQFIERSTPLPSSLTYYGIMHATSSSAKIKQTKPAHIRLLPST
ncbi:hypothetical protein D9613_011924 [Agrocybe pediades]|uniref:Uncharacterized protein n=1 Tax=Agrocybe pediades TaxID=84607 RepID=A0A8H4QFA3_9AGAR|nr:hypothetical protein D9613_011924 [Agrocybe pediades]